MMSGRKLLLEDVEVEKIVQMLRGGKSTGLFRLEGGDLINMSSIESITEPELKPHFMGCPMNDKETRVFIQGEWRDFAGDKKDIEYKPLKQNNETNLLQRIQ